MSVGNMSGEEKEHDDGTNNRGIEGEEGFSEEAQRNIEERCPECNATPYNPQTVCGMCGLEPAGEEIAAEDQAGLMVDQGARRRGPSPYGPAFDSTVPLNKLDQYARKGVPQHLARDVYECANRLFGRARADRLFANGFLDLFIRPLSSHRVAAELESRLRVVKASMPKDPVSSFTRSRKCKRWPNGLNEEGKVIALTLALALLEDELLAIEQRGTDLQCLLLAHGLDKKHVIDAKLCMLKVVRALVKADLVHEDRLTGRRSRQEIEEERCMMLSYTLVERLVEKRLLEDLEAQIKERVEAMLADDAHPQYRNRTALRRWALATWTAFGAIGYLDGNQDVIAEMFGLTPDSLTNTLRTLRAADPHGHALDADQLRIHARLDRRQQRPSYPALEDRGLPENILRVLGNRAPSHEEPEDEGTNLVA
jgi:hypothetical protein